MKRILKNLACLCLVLAVVIMPLTGAVTKAEAATPRLSKTSATIYVGKSLTLKVSGTTKKVAWSSSNKAVAKVSTSGKVTGVKKGSATIRAKVGTKTLKCAVTVKPPKATSLTVTTDLPYTECINGVGVPIRIYEVAVNEFTTSWIKNNFKVATKPSGAEYVIKYNDAQTDKSYSSIPTEPGNYSVRFVAKDNSNAWGFVIINVTNDIEEINVATKLKPAYQITNGAGITFDCYKVKITEYSPTWFVDNFDISTVPADRKVTIKYSRRTNPNYTEKVPTGLGNYLAYISETKNGGYKVIWFDVVDDITITSKLTAETSPANGDGETFDLYKTDVVSITSNWLQDNFTFSTASGNPVDIEVCDLETGEYYGSSIPAASGGYRVRVFSNHTYESFWVWVL